MFTFLLIVQTLVAASMVAVILMQRSEGGGLGVGGSRPASCRARSSRFPDGRRRSSRPCVVVLSIALAPRPPSPGRRSRSIGGGPRRAPPRLPALPPGLFRPSPRGNAPPVVDPLAVPAAPATGNGAR
jgi:preprotein translocase subunit SecG